MEFKEIELKEDNKLYINVLKILNEFERESFINEKSEYISYGNILKHLLAISKMDVAFLFFKNKDKLEVKFGIDKKGNLLDEPEFSTTLLNKAKKSKEPIFLKEVKKMSDSIFDLSIKQAVLIPLISHNENIGVIYTDRRKVKSSKKFTNKDKTLLTYIGKRISNYIELKHENINMSKRIYILEKEQVNKFPDIIGENKNIKNILNEIETISKENINVLITGETGTGKELIAKAIHRSFNKESPYIALNCASIPETLLENELFGHVKGAFTGAIERKVGKFEKANKGVLFLDEIGEMPNALQAKLLRVLDEKKFTPLGSNREIKVNAKIVAATNTNIEEKLKRKEFRKDLFYRLKRIHIHLPALRERKDDIPLLVYHFMKIYNKEFKKKIKTISHEAMEYLEERAWEGNIRDLENFISKAILTCKTDSIELNNVILSNDKEFVLYFKNSYVNQKPDDFYKFKKKIDIFLNEKKNKLYSDYIKEIIRYSKGNITKASKEFKISRQSIYKFPQP